MSKKRNISKFAQVFFKWYCNPRMYEELQGDLEELYQDRLAEMSTRKARLYYIWDVVRCCQPYAWKQIKGQTNSTLGMYKNFYFTAIRNFAKYKSYFAINISGLAIGIASIIFIALYIINELSYDRFHSNHEQTYRVSNYATIRGESNNSATTSGPMGPTLLANYPEVLNATRVLEKGSVLVGRGNTKINEDGVLYADQNFFDVFDFRLLNGDSERALAEPRSIVLSTTYAKKYFGYEDPLGQKMTVEEDTTFYIVTGIFENVPSNSHLQFDALVSINSTDYGNTSRWVGRSLHTYVILQERTELKAFEHKIHELFYKHMAPEIEFFTGMPISEWEGAGNRVEFKLVPIKDIHLRTEVTGELTPPGNITYIYIYGLIGLVILFIALFNFVNLATAHSATRAKEVGVRKVIGSSKRMLVFQFIFESMLVALIATLLATLLVSLLTPVFTDLIGKELAYGITSSYLGWLGIVALAALVGVLAGFYPAFVLSAFKPVKVLKGSLRSGAKAGWLRNVLVTTQFAASIVIVIGTLAIYQQINFMLTKNLGFDKEQILVIKRPDGLQENLEVFKEELIRNSNISLVANSETIPGKTYDIRSYRTLDDPETFLFLNNQVTYDHLDLMGVELVGGRFFSKDFGADSNAVVLNESAAAMLGFDDPIGQTLRSAFKKDRPITIIGVVKDYNIESLHKQVGPVSLELDENAVGYLSVRMSSNQNTQKTVGYIEETWSKHSNMPFQYFFFDQDYQNLYKAETTTGKILLVFASLSVFIACLGLIGLIAFTASLRQKEIGIRKVLGAGSGSLIRLMSAQVTRLILVATLVSWPLAYFATDFWLQNFADRIQINPWLYIGATLTVVTVVSLAISFQTMKAVRSNPVDSLKDE